MRQTTLLLGTAGLTLAVLLAGFLAFRTFTGPQGEAASSAPSASAASAEPVPSASVRESAAPSVKPGGASASPAPTPSATPFRTAGPTPVPGETVTYTFKGNQYINSDIPPGGAVTNLASGAIRMTTGTASSDEMTLTYRLVLPAGRVVTSYRAKLCGIGSGNFWEIYGPPGANPVEYEVVPPVSDGCWHFSGSSMTDTTVLAIIGHGSQMQVDRVDYIVTFR